MRTMGILRRILLMVMAGMMLLACIPAFGEEWADLPLDVGSKGDTVLAVKQRLYELRYYRSNEFTRKYTEDTAKTVRAFQRDNGLPETGIVDETTMAALMPCEKQNRSCSTRMLMLYPVTEVLPSGVSIP